MSCSFRSTEYQKALAWFRLLVSQHLATMIPGQPQLNVCDPAAMVSMAVRLSKGQQERVLMESGADPSLPGWSCAVPPYTWPYCPL